MLITEYITTFILLGPNAKVSGNLSEHSDLPCDSVEAPDYQILSYLLPPQRH